MSTRPEITVLGLYSPQASVARFEQFVRDYVEECDPANFDAKTLDAMKGLGREEELVPNSRDLRREIEEEIRESLGSAVYVEVLIRNVDGTFDAGDFSQPDPRLGSGMSQVAWNETYLSDGGEAVVAGYPLPKVPEGPNLRVVFTIHYWDSELPLMSSYGPLSCPAVTPLPDRLWQLVPYVMPD